MWFRVLAERLRGLFARKKSDGELEAELCAHLEMHAEENMRRGMSPDEARLAAKKEFGGVEQAMETYRDARGLPFLETFVQDLRYGVHGLVKTPGFALIAILTLALGPFLPPRRPLGVLRLHGSARFERIFSRNRLCSVARAAGTFRRHNFHDPRSH